jgi:hypothetical protein
MVNKNRYLNQSTSTNPAFAHIIVIINTKVVAPETGLTGYKNNKIFKNQKMVIENRGQQPSPIFPAVSYCFVLHIMYSSFAFAKQDIRQLADRPAPAGDYGNTL